MSRSGPQADTIAPAGPNQSADLLVRQHERLACDLAAHARVDSDRADQVVFSRSAAPGGRGDGEVAVRVVDVSPGGLGLRSSVYVPRGTRLAVSVTPRDTHALPQSDLFAVRVQRCAMVDRSPTYYLGTAFVNSDPSAVARLSELAESEGANRAQQ